MIKYNRFNEIKDLCDYPSQYPCTVELHYSKGTKSDVLMISIVLFDQELAQV
jgi:hypothetical protein